MPPRTFIDAIRETLADEMRRDETVIVLGEDVGKKGGVFLATDGLWAEFGDDRVIDTPLTESMIVGRLDRRGGQRPAPGRRDPVRRLHLPGLQPDRVRGGADALPLERRLRRPDDDPCAVRRRRPRRALPLAVGRGVLHARAGPQGGRAVHPVRRPRPAPLVDPRRGPGPVLRAQEDVSIRPRRRPRHRLHGPARQGQGHPSRARR